MVQGKKMIYLITSAAQLNCITWAMKNKVIDYCIENVEKIKQHYNTVHDMPSPEDGKRRRLCESPPQGVRMRKIATVIKYKDDIRSISLGGVSE